MRSFYLFVVFLLIGVFSVSAQPNIDDILLSDIPNCENVAYNSTQLIDKYFNEQAFDSLSFVLNKWEEYCGETEPLLRTKILNSIQTNNFSETKYPGDLMEMIFQYTDRIEYANEDNYHIIYEYNKILLGYIPLNSEFDLLTTVWAETLLQEKNLTAPEKALCLLYSNQVEEFWKYLKGNDLKGTEIKRVYDEEVSSIKQMAEGNFGFLTGIKVPTSNLYETIGIKPIFGFQLGVKYRKIQYDLSIAFRAGKAKEPYLVKYADELWETDHYFGGYIGADISYELTRNRKTELDLLTGIALDGFDTVKSDPSNNISGKSINSLNINFGLGYRFFVKNNNYLGMQVKYNFVNYKNKLGTNLDGDYVSVIFSYNFFGNKWKHQALDTMQLK